jgi:hypothetical protein
LGRILKSKQGLLWIIVSTSVGVAVLFLLVSWAGNGRHSGVNITEQAEPPGQASRSEPEANHDEMTMFHERAHRALLANGFSSTAADTAALALEDYVSATGSHDIDALAAFADAHGAEVDPTLLGPVKQMLAVVPDHAKPAGSGEWSDLDILRNTQYKTKFRIWGEVDAERIEVVRFQGADVLVSEIKFYRIGPQPGGGHASIHAAPFRVRDLELKLQKGDAAGAIVTFPVTDDNGTKQVISVLLGEYAPGKWYPVRHRTVSSTPPS